MKEIWKPVPNYETLYEVSNLGRVRSLFRYKKVLKPSPITNGYLTVELWKNKQRKRIGVHRLVAMCFCKNPNNKPFVNHIDETKTNNCADNLEWVTHVENCNYGTAVARRLAHVDYCKIRRAIPVNQYDKSGRLIARWNSISECARAVGVHESCVRRMIQGKARTCAGYVFKEAI